MCRTLFEEFVLEKTEYLVFREMFNGCEGAYCDPVVEKMWLSWKKCWDLLTAGA